MAGYMSVAPETSAGGGATTLYRPKASRAGDNKVQRSQHNAYGPWDSAAALAAYGVQQAQLAQQ
eukprot:scaffold657978_cov100-Prasinocladus_malaysianus.AAC.1